MLGSDGEIMSLPSFGILLWASSLCQARLVSVILLNDMLKLLLPCHTA